MSAPPIAEVAPLAETGLKRDMPLVPEDSVAGRALVVVIAIMTFLACLTAGGALLITQASLGWRGDVSGEATIQIKPRAGDDADALVAKAADIAARSPGVADARALSKDDTQRMLEPWLGQGLDLSQLTIPRLIVIHMRGRDLADLEGLRTALARAVPQASLDDHRMWLSRLDTMADVIVTFALAIFALMILAMATAAGFATRGAMAGNREIIEVLHFVGASDAFIATQFQAHFMRLGFRGAAIGCAGAALFFLGASSLSNYWAGSSGGEEIAALFGAFALGATGYFAIAAIGLFIAGLTGFLSRLIVFTHLRGLP